MRPQPLGCQGWLYHRVEQLGLCRLGHVCLMVPSLRVDQARYQGEFSELLGVGSMCQAQVPSGLKQSSCSLALCLKFCPLPYLLGAMKQCLGLMPQLSCLKDLIP